MFATAISIFVLLFTTSVFCENKPCDIEDSICMTERGNLAFGQFMLEKQNVESSNLLHRASIDASIPNFLFKLSNASLSGMRKCHLDLLKITRNELKYECHLRCPHLTFNSEYDVKGNAGSVFLEGRGTSKVDYYDLIIYFIGNYEIKIKNGQKHIYFKHAKLDLDLKEKAHYDFPTIINGDKEKFEAVLKQMNENQNLVDKSVQISVLTPLMDQHLDNINAYTDIVPLAKLFSL